MGLVEEQNSQQTLLLTGTNKTERYVVGEE